MSNRRAGPRQPQRAAGPTHTDLSGPQDYQVRARGPYVTPSDCRSDEGIVVGLVDGMIAQARVVSRYLQTHTVEHDVREALLDFQADEDVARMLDRQL